MAKAVVTKGLLMNQLAKDFRAYVLSQDLPGFDITQLDDEHISLTSGDVQGAVNFYCFDDMPEIVELSIIDRDCPEEPKFFLHFELDDERHAEELFSEMAEALQQTDRFDTTNVLLCCTAGLTTTMFASKLEEAAKTLSLDYSFDAKPLAEAQATGGAYDVVLLAPQVGYQRKAVTKAFPQAAVVEIPAKVFAAFDAGAALKLVMHLVDDHTVYPAEDRSNLKFMRDLKDDKRIMVITCIHRPNSGWTGWRVYDHGTIIAYGSVTKAKPSIRDIEDILSTLHMKGIHVHELDAVGIAVPGIVNSGRIGTWTHFEGAEGYELGRTLSKNYGTKVFVDNNANAAAVGCYITQTDYDSVVLHTQQTGYLVGGQGIVVDGHLVKGRKNFAGELTPLFMALYGANEETGNHELAWSPEGMRQLVAPLLAADISLVSPDAIYVAVDLIDDMDTLREEIAKYVHEEQYIPDLVRVSDYREMIALGELALCLQKLHNPRPHRKH